MATTFKTPINNVTTTVGATYTAGDGTLTVATGTGGSFGSPSSGSPIRITVITNATYRTTSEVLTIYYVTGRSGDVLTLDSTGGYGKESTTDRNYSAGASADIVEMRWTAQGAADIHTAVNNLENAGYATDSSVVHLAGTETITGGKTFSTLPTLGTLTGVVKATSGAVAAAGGSDLPVMTASGATPHSGGAVPDPGATAGTTKYLREDASWQVPPGTGGMAIGNDVTGANWNRFLTTGTSDIHLHQYGDSNSGVPFNLNFSTTGSSAGSPRYVGSTTTTTNEVMSFQFDAYQCWRTGGGCNQQMIAYNGLELYGRSTSLPTLTVSAVTPTGSPHVTVFGVNAADTGLAVVGATSQTGALQTWMTNSTTTVASVNKDGVYKGAQAFAYVAKTTTYQATAADGVICCTAASGWTLTLPAVSTVPAGFFIVVKKTDNNANVITVDGNASETIDGALTYTGLSAQYKYVQLVSDGANWNIVGSN